MLYSVINCVVCLKEFHNTFVLTQRCRDHQLQTSKMKTKYIINIYLFDSFILELLLIKDYNGFIQTILMVQQHI